MNDLISREEAFEAAYQGLRRPSSDPAWIRICNELKNVPPSNQWIPVSERLPEENGSYLTTTRNGRVRVNHFYKYHGIFGYQNNAIAWMPLPVPYKEVE